MENSVMLPQKRKLSRNKKEGSSVNPNTTKRNRKNVGTKKCANGGKVSAEKCTNGVNNVGTEKCTNGAEDSTAKRTTRSKVSTERSTNKATASTAKRTTRSKVSTEKSTNKAKAGTETCTLESATEKHEYSYWLQQHDIADIARIEYGYGTDEANTLFEVVGSVQHINNQLLQFKNSVARRDEKRPLTFIVNLNNSHWVTLVISCQNGQYDGYYVDSLGNNVPHDIREVLQKANVSINDVSIAQQKDGHNCGLWALENARDINAVLQEGRNNIPTDIRDRLQIRNRDNDYFIRMRKDVSERLSIDLQRSINLEPILAETQLLAGTEICTNTIAGTAKSTARSKNSTGKRSKNSTGKRSKNSTGKRSKNITEKRKKERKRRSPIRANEDMETITIKCGFRKFVKDFGRLSEEEIDVIRTARAIEELPTPDLIYNNIQDTVHLVSNVMIEVSNSLYYVVNEQPGIFSNEEKDPNLLPFFYNLKTHCRKDADLKEIYFDSYNDLRTEIGLPKYDCRFRSAVIQESVRELTRNLRTNITTHMYYRVRYYFFTVLEAQIPESVTGEEKRLMKRVANDNVSEIMKRLFEGSANVLNEVCFVTLDNFRADFGLLSTLSFKKDHVRMKWWKYIEFLQKLQKFMYHQKKKSFHVIPIYKYGRKHVLFTNTGFRELLSNLGYPVPKNVNKDQLKEYWKKCFNIDKFRRKDMTFRSFSTNGVDVSILFERPKRQDLECSEARAMQLKKAEKTLKDKKYSKTVGIDPGLKCLFGMVSINNNKPVINRNTANVLPRGQRHYKNSLLKNEVFRKMIGEESRDNKLKKFVEKEPIYKKFIEDSKEQSPKSDDWHNYIRVRLEYFAEMQRLHCNAKVTRLKFDKYIRTRRTLDKIAGYICQPYEPGTRTLIGYGNQKIEKHIRGYVRIANKGFFEALKRNKNADVFMVDEYGTTVTCSKCFHRLKVSESPHRFAECLNCKTMWNRDINAGNNMIHIVLAEVQGKPRHPAFCPKVDQQAEENVENRHDEEAVDDPGVVENIHDEKAVDDPGILENDDSDDDYFRNVKLSDLEYSENVVSDKNVEEDSHHVENIHDDEVVESKILESDDSDYDFRNLDFSDEEYYEHVVSDTDVEDEVENRLSVATEEDVIPKSPTSLLDRKRKMAHDHFYAASAVGKLLQDRRKVMHDHNYFRMKYLRPSTSGAPKRRLVEQHQHQHQQHQHQQHQHQQHQHQRHQHQRQHQQKWD